MEAAFDQQFCLAFMDQLHRLGGGCLAMGNVDKLERSDIEIVLPGNGFDPLGGTDENRNEQTDLDGLDDKVIDAIATEDVDP